MVEASRDFQIFAKPAGSLCNLRCRYCYYLEKERLPGQGAASRMADDLLELYIVQHIEASPNRSIRFSWHGGEPTLLGVDYFRRIVELQRAHLPPGREILNGIQTNGTLLNDEWCRFLAAEGFTVGLSLDGPREMHDLHRLSAGGEPTHQQTMRGYELLRRHGIPCDILCVLHEGNVRHPLDLYRYFRELQASHLTFLPLVEPLPDSVRGVSDRTVPADAFGDFLCAVFDEWLGHDIGRVQVQIFEEAAGTALGREHQLCVFRPTCGDIPVIAHNGDFFSCDHFVDSDHRLGNIRETSLVALLESSVQRSFGRAKQDGMPLYCRQCAFLSMCNGGCPKDRFISTPAGDAGLNYLCSGYRRFFAHCQPFLSELAGLRFDPSAEQRTPLRRNGPGGKTGRNDPCPCGSGRKYKKCCLGK